MERNQRLVVVVVVLTVVAPLVGAVPGGATHGDNSTQDGFEDQDLSEYIDIENGASISSTAYSGDAAVVLTDTNQDGFIQNGHRTGSNIYRPVDPSQPSILHAAVRIDNGDFNDLRVYWNNETGGRITGINLDVYNSAFYYNGSQIATISPYTWYFVRFEGIDWEDETIARVRMNGNVIAQNLSFLHSADAVHNVSLSVNDAGTGSQVWVDDVTLSGGAAAPTDPVASGDRLSFENASVGPTTLPGEWFVRADGGVARVTDAYPGHGNQSLRVRGSSNLRKSEVGIRVNLTGVDWIRYDAYIDRTNTFAGEIYVSLVPPNTTGRGDDRLNGFTLKGEGVWHNDTVANVTQYTGEWVFLFHARGDGNGGYFDDVRFYGPGNETRSASNVVVGAGSNETDDGQDDTNDSDGGNTTQTQSANLTVQRSISTTTASPGDSVSVSVTLRLNQSIDRLAITEQFTPPLQATRVKSVTVNGQSRIPTTVDFQGDAGFAVLQSLEAGDTVTVTYSATLPANATAGSTYTINGSVTAPNDTVVEPADTITIATGLSQYAGQDGVVQTGELRSAISAWVSGTISTTDLRTLISSWVQQTPV